MTATHSIGVSAAVSAQSPPNTAFTTPSTWSAHKLLTILHLGCIVAFALVLTWGLQGKAPINGDDVRVIHKTVLNGPEYRNKPYSYTMWAQRRLHILPILYGNYQVADYSMERGNLIWLAIYVLSAFAAYAYLRAVVSPSVALLGSIFYLGYSSKYEPLTWWSAGAYTIVWLIFFVLALSLESKLRFRTKSIVTAATVWITLHIYEVFTLMAPIFSLLLLIRRQRERKVITMKDFAFAMLPTAVVAIHVAILACAPIPIFSLDPTTVNKIPIAARITAGFTSALDSCVGPRHMHIVTRAASSFKHYYAKEHPELNIILWVAISLTVIAFLASIKWSVNSAVSATTVTEHLLMGAYALTFAGFIGFVSNFCVTPSRLTGLPSIGLMIAICGGLELVLCLARKSSTKKRHTLTALFCALCCGFLIWSVCEVKCLAALLRQSGEVHDFDLQIAKKIKKLHPQMAVDEEIFVRMPLARREERGAWTNFSSGFNTGRAFETFWYLYDQEPGASRFSCSPQGNNGEPIRVAQILEEWEKHGLSKVYPYVVDSSGNVLCLERIDLTNKTGAVVRSLDFSRQHKSAPEALKIKQQIQISEVSSP